MTASQCWSLRDYGFVTVPCSPIPKLAMFLTIGELWDGIWTLKHGNEQMDSSLWKRHYLTNPWTGFGLTMIVACPVGIANFFPTRFTQIIFQIFLLFLGSYADGALTAYFFLPSSPISPLWFPMSFLFLLVSVYFVILTLLCITWKQLLIHILPRSKDDFLNHKSRLCKWRLWLSIDIFAWSVWHTKYIQLSKSHK